MRLRHTLQDLGDAVTAERLYRKAIELRPHFAGARSNLGNLLKEQFKLLEALSEYEVRPSYWARPDAARAV